jgi:hypothetical protein
MWPLVDIALDENIGRLSFSLNRDRLRNVRRREGRYLLRSNLTESDPALLWQYYIQLVAVEEAVKTLKGDLAIRPVFHHDERRIEAQAEGALERAAPSFISLSLGETSMAASFVNRAQSHLSWRRRITRSLATRSALCA